MTKNKLVCALIFFAVLGLLLASCSQPQQTTGTTQLPVRPPPHRQRRHRHATADHCGGSRQSPSMAARYTSASLSMSETLTRYMASSARRN